MNSMPLEKEWTKKLKFSLVDMSYVESLRDWTEQTLEVFL